MDQEIATNWRKTKKIKSTHQKAVENMSTKKNAKFFLAKKL